MPNRQNTAPDRPLRQPIHDHAPERFRIYTSWLSTARSVAGGEVNHRFVEPNARVMLPFTALPFEIRDSDRDVLELFLRAAGESALPTRPCCEGCVQLTREAMDIMAHAADLTMTGLPSFRRRGEATTPFVLLTAISEPVNQARKYFRRLDSFLSETELPHETRRIAVEAAATIGSHVHRTVGRLEDIVTPGSFLRRRDADPQFWRGWNLDDYESAFSARERGTGVRQGTPTPELFPPTHAG